MKKLLMMAAIATLVMSCGGKKEQKTYNQGINVIPVPVELTVKDSTMFTVTGNTVIAVLSPDFATPAAYLSAKIQGSTGYSISVVDKVPETNFVSLELDKSIVAPEGYTLSSDVKGVVIKASTAQGAFYGVQTLLQLLPAEIESPTVIDYIAWELPSVDVKDEPRFKYRGMMLDPCRHFASVEFVKKQLDVLAMFKLNRFHWHLTDDQAWRIEIKKYPKLTELGSVRTEGDGSKYGPFFYTQEQIKEVVAYAAERYIDVIPEIELPGHAMAALTGYPELSCTGGPFTPRIIWGVEEDVFCVGKEATFKFLEDVVSEVVELFPSAYFNVGGDECPKSRWEKCADCQARAKELGLKEKVDANGTKHSVEEQLQSYTITRMEKFISTKGKKIIGWDEILEGGLAPSATVLSWRGEWGGEAAAMQNHDVIMSPNPEGMYINFYQGAAEVEPVTIGGDAPLKKTYSFEPVPENLPADKHQYIIGAQGNMWTEYALDESQMENMIYPRIIAVAELTWSPADKRDFESFSKRINNAYVRLDCHDVNYHIPMPEGVLTQNVVFTGDSVVLEFTNTRDYPMVYTTDGTEPTAKSAIYAKGITVTADKSEVKIATLLPSEKLSKVRTIPVVKEALAPAATVETKNTGAKLKIAEGLYVNHADYENARFGTDTVVMELSDGKWDMKKPSLAVFEGYVTMPEDGVYTLTTDTDQLFIDGELVVSNPTLSRHLRTKVQKALAAGKHSYKMVFNNMINAGWPNSWSEVGFQYKLEGGQWVRASGEALTY